MSACALLSIGRSYCVAGAFLKDFCGTLLPLRATFVVVCGGGIIEESAAHKELSRSILD